MSASTPRNDTKKSLNLKAVLEQLQAKPTLPLLIAAAVAITVTIVLLLWAREPEYRVLYSNLSDQDGGNVVNQLAQMNIPYRLTNNGNTIMIPAQRVYETRLKLAQEGLPKGGAVGFELLDQEKFGISQFSEQVNYQRALEGELARTIETLGPVRHARVHLAIPKPSLFVREQKTPTASVTLTLHAGRALDDGQISAISYMVASAVPDLPPANVTVVDQNGRLLTQNGETGQGLNAAQLKYTSEIEADYQRRILAILAPVVGRANVHAQVTAQVDFSSHEQTSEQYRPNADPAHMTIRSRQISTNEQQGLHPNGGVPGALSNQPTPAASAPIEGKKSEKDEKGALRHFNRQHDETTNYEVDRTLTHITRNVGNIERLSVAVVVNYTVDAEGKRIPLTPEQMDKINALTREAMGYSTQRGDTLNVVNAPFADEEQEPTVPFWQQPQFWSLLATAGRYLLALLVVWLMWRKGLRPMWLRHQELQRERLAAAKETAKLKQSNRAPSREDREEQSKKQLALDVEINTQQLRQFADQDSKVVALVIRNWMKSNETKNP